MAGIIAVKEPVADVNKIVGLSYPVLKEFSIHCYPRLLTLLETITGDITGRKCISRISPALTF